MKSLMQFISESFLVQEKFSSGKLRDLVKKHGKAVPDDPRAPFGFIHDKGLNVGRIVSAVIPLLTDDEFQASFEKPRALFDNQDDMTEWLKKNAKDVDLRNVKDGSHLGSTPDYQAKLFKAGYFWVVFKDHCIALFKVTDLNKLKECRQAINKLSGKLRSRTK